MTSSSGVEATRQRSAEPGVGERAWGRKDLPASWRLIFVRTVYDFLKGSMIFLFATTVRYMHALKISFKSLLMLYVYEFMLW